MTFFNTLTRRREPFAPLEDNRVRMYNCGPTVYNYAHIGNYRAYVFEDILRRALELNGYEVVQVMNLTDVDDKTIRGAREAGLSLDAYTRRFKDAFFEDLAILNVEPAAHYPAATEHIGAMIKLVQALEARGHAYRSDDGSVYFNVASFPDYGRLARLDMSGLQAGARVSHDEYEKESVADFALWKAWDAEDGDVGWDSPWGRGRPGWHIECSAMGMQYLGETFDIHTGGVDNMFPHHVNEIAQSEGATGKPFVTTWLHCEHLRVDGRKMAKSLGNFYTLRDLMERGYTGREVRYVLMAGHYRQELNFTLAALDAARAAIKRLEEFRSRLVEAAGGADAGAVPAWADEGRRQFRDALNDDLGMPDALAALFACVHAGHRALDEDAVAPGEAAAALAVLDDLDRVLGLAASVEEGPGDDVTDLVARREAARAARDWAEADRIRDALAGIGWEVRDSPEGPRLRKRS